jgi:hypothetical protein
VYRTKVKHVPHYVTKTKVIYKYKYHSKKKKKVIYRHR